MDLERDGSSSILPACGALIWLTPELQRSLGRSSKRSWQSSRCKGNRLRWGSCTREKGWRFQDSKYLGIYKSIPRL